MFLVTVLAILVLVGVTYQTLGSFRDRRRFPAPGRLIGIGGFRLHLYGEGAGDPPVILESGIAGSLLGWALVQYRIAEFTRVCSYDRAGLGWSQRSPHARTVEQMTSELHALLTATRIHHPYVLVGHSFGGLLIRAYAYRWPGEVAGLVFVDPVSLTSWRSCSEHDRKRLRVGAQLSRRGAVLARLGIVRAALTLLAAGGRRIPKLVGRTAAGHGSSTIERLIGEVQRLPEHVRPIIQSHWSSPRCFHAMADYLACLPACAAEAFNMPIPAQTPFIVLSGANATAEELSERDEWVAKSEHGRHVRVENSGHWIQIHRPEVVVEAVRELVEQIRADEESRKRRAATGGD